MARPAGDAEPAAAAAQDLVLGAALALFVEKGFHGTSMRDIAARAGTSVSHTYYYFPSKHHLLSLITSGITRELIADLERAASLAGSDPAARLAALVRAHVLLHTRRKAEAFVGNTELRSLRPEDRPGIVGLRDAVSSFFKAAIADGLREEIFACPEPAEVVLAIVSMCTAVANWYRADGPVAPEVMADRYAAIALRMAGHGSGRRSAGSRRN